MVDGMSRTSWILMLLVGFACTESDKDGSGSETDPPATTAPVTDTSAETGPGGPDSTGGVTGGTTNIEDPTSAGTASADTGSSSSGGMAETGPAEVSFTDVFEQVIMTNGCQAGYCHGGGAGGLEMTDEATTYANLVEVAATMPSCGQSLRVSPGSLDESILWYRVRPAALDAGMPCAPKMPQGSMGLSEAQAQLVSDWISGGALE